MIHGFDAGSTRVPGMIPGLVPGMIPGVVPDMIPGVVPDMIPGLDPILITHVNPLGRDCCHYATLVLVQYHCHITCTCARMRSLTMSSEFCTWVPYRCLLCYVTR